ncbi:MAG: magnesium/cobalt transporter CorA [Deltaproteobacteria bacterium]|nr:magnesium/cobalt transporter CorA [Deltaproteobacteria bacterium]
MIQIVLWDDSGNTTTTQDIGLVKKALSEQKHRFWVDFDSPTKEELSLLEEIFHFHPLAVKAVRDLVGLPKIDFYEDYLFLVLHRVFYHFESEKCELREFEVFFSKQFVVTTHQAHLSRTFHSTREQVCEHRIELAQHGTSYLLFRLLSMALQDYKPAIEKWQDTLDEIEHSVFERSRNQILERILEFKKLVTHMRRSLLPEREVLIELYENRNLPIFAKGTHPYFKVVLESMNVLMRELESLRDHATSIFDIYTAMLSIRMTETSHKLNYVMQRLTMAATIFMPLTFIVGVYGMNFKFMPELNWKWGYFLLWGLMVSVTSGMVFFFKRKKWF